MEAGQNLGRYRLLKRLSRDALGESFRAGRIGAQGIDRVVLLRLFNGDAIDPQAFWQAVEGRAGLSGPESPHLGAGVDLAVEDGIPYLAYDYVSGKSLRELQRQAAEKPFPIPVEHALFVVERSALGLATAYEHRFEDQRMVHGFLTPDWIRLSSEGEVRLFGVEVSPGLQTLSPEARQGADLRPYLSPEVTAGEEPTSADDVFSLASILYELLTGAALPPGDQIAAVEGATLASEGSPVPPALRQLLQRSLVPRSQRVSSVDRWRIALSTLITEGDYSPTTFNLAFFLHTLFKGEIDEETVEIEPGAGVDAEATPAPPIVLDAAEVGEAEVAEPLDVDEVADVIELEEIEPEPRWETETPTSRTLAGVARATDDDGRRKKLLLGAAAAVVVLGGVAAAFLVPWDSLVGGGVDAPVEVAEQEGVPPELPVPGDETAVDPAEADPDAGAPETPADGEGTEATAEGGAAVPASEDDSSDLVDTSAAVPPPTPDEIETRVRQLVARGVDNMEASLKADYEARLAELQEQLEEARRAERAAAEAQETPAASADSPPAGVQSPAGPTGQPSAQPASGTAAQPPPATRAPAGPPTGSRPAATTPAQTAEKPEPEPQPEPQPEPEPEPQPEPVKAGDIVRPGPGVTPPRIVKQARPVYPPAARKFAKRARVELRVLVGTDGKPETVEQTSSRARFGFDEAARSAALATVWSPASKDGVPVKMWVDLTINFQP